MKDEFDDSYYNEGESVDGSSCEDNNDFYDQVENDSIEDENNEPDKTQSPLRALIGL